MGYGTDVYSASGLVMVKGDKGDKGDSGDNGELFVTSYGAKGDGITDDTAAIRLGMQAASSSGKVLKFPIQIPAVSGIYLISDTLRITSNTALKSNGAQIFMASRATALYIFDTDPAVVTDNISINGFKIASINDRPGDAGSYYAGQMVSNVYGIALRGATNVTIQDVIMTDLIGGLAAVPNNTATNYNKDIRMFNVHIYRTMTPLLIKNLRNFWLSNATLDAIGSNNTHLHCWYIDTDVQNVYADNVRFTGSLGGAGVQIYSEENIPLKNAVFSNITVDGCKTGMFIYKGASDISVTGLTVQNCQNIINVNDCNNVTIKGGTAKNITQNLFYLDNAKNLSISGMVIDASAVSSYDVIHLLDIVQNVIFDNIIFTNVPGSKYFVGADDASVNVKDFTFQNSNVSWVNPDPANVMPFLFANTGGLGVNALIQNNKFSVAAGSNWTYLVYGVAGVNVETKNNKLNNFARVSWTAANTIQYGNSINGKMTRTTGTATIGDGGKITHNLPGTPTYFKANTSVAGQNAWASAQSATDVTVAIKTSAGAAGTSQTVTWEAEYNL